MSLRVTACHRKLKSGINRLTNHLLSRSNVAGILAGETFGVAKKAQLVAVKACDFRGCPVSALLDSMQWTHDVSHCRSTTLTSAPRYRADHVQDASANGRVSTSVVNLSVGWIYDQSLNDMVESLVASGIAMFVAAGNDNVSIPVALTHNFCKQPPNTMPRKTG